MNKLSFTIVFTIITCLLQAQTYSKQIEQIATSGKNSEWIKFREDKKIQASDVFKYYKNAFGLGKNDTMKIKKQETDNIGYTHYRFQQYYKDIPIRGAEYIIHAKDSIAVNGNGKLVTGLKLNGIPILSESEARNKAIAYINAQEYIWEDKNMEDQLKSIKKDTSATYYPKPELIIADKKCSGKYSNYKLAYKVDIYAGKPLSRNYVFIDANTGNILFLENRLMNTDVPGSANTKYSGTKTIWTDSVSPTVFRLRETHNGNGVETYDMNKSITYNSSVDFTDSDNYWNNFNTNQDEVATDAHYAAEITYQYYFQKFGRLSYDNNNSKLLNYVHYDYNYSNAFWDGIKMTYGDGDGSSYKPLTSIDICGHEITHGVDEYSANLIYQDEPGALNEAFSDIFGTAIEFFDDSINGNWNIGEDIYIPSNTGFRSLSNPKSHQLPDTYHGQYWKYSDPFDFGGVHTNMGPLCYWFYLLSVGGSGNNDIGNTYTVTGIGIDSAILIAYRMLTVYLTSASTYFDALEASINAAIDLYGVCSNPVIQTTNAFHAIGIGYAVADDDFILSDIKSPISQCGLSNAENISILIKYNGCNVSIPAGDTIYVSYKVNAGNIINDTIYLSSMMNGGDSLLFTFDSTYDFSVTGLYYIDCWIKYKYDNHPANDSIKGFQIASLLQQNIDIGVCKINGPNSSCHMTNAEHINIDVKFYGCDSLVAGDTIVLAYRLNGGTPVKDTLYLPNTIMAKDTFNYIFPTPADMSIPGNYSLDAWTEYNPDTINTNDTIKDFYIKNPYDISFDTIGFEESNINLLTHIETTQYSHAFISTIAHNTGSKGFQMTGGNIFDYINSVEIPDSSNTWNINEILSAKLNFCVDATAWTSANMRFDLKQTDGGNIYTLYLGAGDYTKASNLRILVNGTQIGGTYNPTTPNNDPFITHFINLDAYAGQQFTVTIETRNLSKDTLVYILDNAYIDNVCFSPVSQQNVEEYNSDLSIGIYPNPFTDNFTLKFDSDKQESATIEISDIIGRIVSKQIWKVGIGSNRTEINLNEEPSGIYLLKVNSSKGFAVKSIVKK